MYLLLGPGVQKLWATTEPIKNTNNKNMKAIKSGAHATGGGRGIRMSAGKSCTHSIYLNKWNRSSETILSAEINWSAAEWCSGQGGGSRRNLRAVVRAPVVTVERWGRQDSEMG